MIVYSAPRQSGKTFAVAEYMTQPGNEDVVCLAPTLQQAMVVYRAALEFDLDVNPLRFTTHRYTQLTPRSRVVIDEADVVIEQLLNCRVDMIALTERSTT